MKNKILAFFLALISIEVSAQNKYSVSNGGGYDCLYAYNVQYASFNQQFLSDMNDCIVGMALDWIGMDPISSGLNSTCAWDALNRFYTNCDNAATSFAACSGVNIVN